MTLIGITKLTNNWESILKQLGLKYDIISSSEKLTRYSALIINSELNTTLKKSIHTYVLNGGALLDNTGVFKSTFGYKCRFVYKRYIIVNNEIYKGLIDINNSIHEIYDQGNSKWIPFLINSQNNGIYSFFGLPIENLFSNQKSKRAKFISSKERHPEEEINKVSKGPISSLIFNLLKEIHIRRNIPFIHKWFFPSLEKNIFLFREDTDFSSEDDIIQIQDITQKLKIKVSWFIHVKENESFLKRYKSISEDEIALHCNEHFTSPNPTLIRNDILEGISKLNNANIIPSGYAAPYGLWNNNLGKILKDLKFIYSSEFSLIHDSLPFSSNLTNNLIQIPIHPVCIDSLLKAGKTDNEIVQYYKSVIDFNISNMIPIALYDHPGHNHYNILNEVFKYIISLNINSYTFKEYAKWWQQREESNFTASIKSNQNIEIVMNNNKTICLWTHQKKYLLINKTGSYNLKSLHEYQLKDYNNINFDNLSTIRKVDLNMIKRELLAKYIWRIKK